jgi:hypothetical protein
MPTTFTKLNDGWNAEPNGHEPQISEDGADLLVRFLLNDLLFPEYRAAEAGVLRFRGCWRYRLGSSNDEGWHRGQCRFSRLAPEWGQFYEVHGDLLLDATPNREAFDVRGVQLEPDPLGWVTLGTPGSISRHFLFYLRDQTFECDATEWAFSVIWKVQPDGAANRSQPIRSDTNRTSSASGFDR